MLLATVDWTDVLDHLIIGLPAILAAVFAFLIHRQVRTPSGKSLGTVAEYAHDTAIANNLLLSHKNGPTKNADVGELHKQGETPPQVPK